jgi:hypothetical protein
MNENIKVEPVNVSGQDGNVDGFKASAVHPGSGEVVWSFDTSRDAAVAGVRRQLAARPAGFTHIGA